MTFWALLISVIDSRGKQVQSLQGTLADSDGDLELVVPRKRMVVVGDWEGCTAVLVDMKLTARGRKT